FTIHGFMTVPFIEANDQTQARREHLEALRQLVGNVYPNKFERSNVTDTLAREDTITSVVASFRRLEPKLPEGQKPSPEELELANAELNKIRVRVAGRLSAPPRVMGKAAFVHLSDGVSRLQMYVRRQDVMGVRNDTEGGEANGWEVFGLLDHGDFIGVEGYLFVTKTGELSVHVEKLQFLAKALLPMPDKMHGINDPEIRQRQRYADLIAGSLKLERDEKDLTPREVFTMLEFYMAYADVNQMMDLHEEMMQSVVQVATGGLTIQYGQHEIDFSESFQRITMKEAITRYRGQAPAETEEPVRIVELFEEFAEPHLIQPTFITDFPKPVSPLSKASPSDPSVAERFEYFVGALESANGFSELNDPEEQYQRFKDQVQQRERGDEEAMVMDEDYIRALSYCMPPAAGIGVGINRLVMLLANKHSIRDVILFPHSDLGRTMPSPKKERHPYNE